MKGVDVAALVASVQHTPPTVAARRPVPVEVSDWGALYHAVGLKSAAAFDLVPDDVIFVRWADRGRRVVVPGVRVGSRLATANAYADLVADLIAWAGANGVQPGRPALANVHEGANPGLVAYLTDNVTRPRRMAQAWGDEDRAIDLLRSWFPERMVGAGPRVIRVYPQDAAALSGLPDVLIDGYVVDVKIARDFADHVLAGRIPVGPCHVVQSPKTGADFFLIGAPALGAPAFVDRATLDVWGERDVRPTDRDDLRRSTGGAPWVWIDAERCAWSRATARDLFDSFAWDD